MRSWWSRMVPHPVFWCPYKKGKLGREIADGKQPVKVTGVAHSEENRSGNHSACVWIQVLPLMIYVTLGKLPSLFLNLMYNLRAILLPSSQLLWDVKCRPVWARSALFDWNTGGTQWKSATILGCNSITFPHVSPLFRHSPIPLY